MDWEAETEIQELVTHMPQLNINQYDALADKEDNEVNDNESTGVNNDGETTGMRNNNKIKGVDRDNESAELGSTGATDKADELAFFEEAITEAER